MKFGCHAVLFRENIKTETEVVLKGLSETGFKGVEIGSRFFGTDEKQYLAGMLNKYGMELSGMHVGCPLKDWLDKEQECADRVMAVAKFVQDMPNKNIVMSGSPADDCSLKEIAIRIDNVAKACLDMGVKLNYHNHAWEFENDAAIFNALVEYAPNLYFGLDLGWVYKGGFDPIETVKKLNGRVAYVHLRDAKERETKEFLDLGEGIFNYPELLRVLKETLPDNGWAVVEYEEGKQDFNRYKKAKDFLDSVKY